MHVPEKEGVNPSVVEGPHSKGTPLIKAAEKGYHSVVKFLLKTGKVDPNACGPLRQTALHLAVVSGYSNGLTLTNGKLQRKGTATADDYYIIVKLLLSADGIKPDNRNYQGKTPVMLALEVSAEGMIAELLRSGNVDVNSRDNFRRMPLIAAAVLRNMGIMKLLLARGADPTMQDEMGDNILRQAAITGNKDIISLCLAVPNRDPNMRDHPGLSALDYAIE